jgi:hypothetical protein
MFGLLGIVILIGFLQAADVVQFLTIISLLFGVLGLAFTIYSSLCKSLDDALKTLITFPVAVALALFLFIFGVVGAFVAGLTGPLNPLNGHIISILANLVPSCSAAVTVAAKYDGEFRSKDKDNSPTSDAT